MYIIKQSSHITEIGIHIYPMVPRRIMHITVPSIKTTIIGVSYVGTLQIRCW